MVGSSIVTVTESVFQQPLPSVTVTVYVVIDAIGLAVGLAMVGLLSVPEGNHI